MREHHQTIILQPGQKLVLHIETPDTMQPIDLDTAKDSYTLKEIAALICQACCISFEELAGKSRKTEFCIPRHVYCYVASKVFLFSLSSTGRHINRDHTTVISSCQKVVDLFDSKDRQMVQCINAIQNHFNVRIL